MDRICREPAEREEQPVTDFLQQKNLYHKNKKFIRNSTDISFKVTEECTMIEHPH